jgi:Tfp pilus assembly protein PilO
MTSWPLAASLALARLDRGVASLLAAALVAVLAWAVFVPMAERDAEAQQRRLDAFRKAQAEAPVATAAAPLHVDALQAFEARLATPELQHQLQQALWQQAAANGLQLSKVDYRHEDDAPAGFTRLSITLPVNGAYPAVRKFLFSLLAQFPGLAMDKLSLKRVAGGTAQVEATVHLTLLVRP